MTAGGDARSRELLDGACFAPVLTSFTARVGALDPAAMSSSPAALARASLEAQRLLGHEVVLCTYEPALLAHACVSSAGGDIAAMSSVGADTVPSSAPISLLLEAVRQITAGLPERGIVLLTVAGPSSLRTQLCERGAEPTPELDAYVGSTFVALTNAAYAAGAGGLALIEHFDDDAPARIARSYRTMRKLTDFHEGVLVSYATGDGGPEGIFDQIFDLDAADGELITARCLSGRARWSTTRGDVRGDIDVSELKAMAARRDT